MSQNQNEEQPSKKIISKEEFLKINKEAADEMARDKNLQAKALEVLIEADKHRWIHQCKWMGEPLLNLPQDMFAIQDIIWETRPDYVIEVGVAWGGSLLFEATLLEMLDAKKVIGVDIFIPDDLRERLLSNKRLAKRIELIEGSSTSEETLAKVKEILNGSNKVLVILDSYHTHDHVLKELESYAPFIGAGYYLVCGDTVVERMPVQEHRPRAWGPGNNPATAVAAFLKVNDRFSINKNIDNKLLLSCHPGGYLKAIK